jgi:hypothetical protein
LPVTCFITPGVPILLGEGELVDGAGEGGGEEKIGGWVKRCNTRKKKDKKGRTIDS